MTQAKFTQYYKDAMNKLVDYLDREQCLAIRVEQIKDKTVVITIGASDGRDFILEFGTVAVREGNMVHVECDSIHIDMHKMIHMEYNTNTPGDNSLPMLEGWNS